MKSFENENLSKLIQGDENALTFFYNKYAQKVYALAFYLLKDRFWSEDVLQEVFVHFWDSRDTLRHDKDLWLILYVMTKQKSLNKLRTILRYEKHKDYHWNEIRENISFQEDTVGFKDMKHMLDMAIQKMTPTQQKIFQMSREEGLSHAEIATILSISPNTVKNHMVAALAILRKYFKGHELISLAIFLGVRHFF